MTPTHNVDYSPPTMNGWQHKGSFVVRFSSETDANAEYFHGRVEHVASGKTLRFKSLEELQEWLRRVLKEVSKEFEQADTLAIEVERPADKA
jgi:predicted HicB family RNase H-like nuclease